MLIAEHSMCQPGRPCPQGDGQDGSPGLALFQRAKSRTSSFSYSSSATRSPRRVCVEVDLRELAVARKGRDLEPHRALGLVGVAAAAELLDQLDHLGDVVGGPRVALGFLDVQRSRSSKKRSAYLPVNSASETPSFAAPLIVLSSMSVRFMTCVTRQPFALQVPAQHVLEHERAQVADVGHVVDRGAAGVEAHVPRFERHDIRQLSAQSVEQPHA